MSSKKIAFEIELPEKEQTLAQLNQQAKQALVLDLLRQKEISQGKAAEMLEINRWELADLMQRHGVLSLDVSQEELSQGLKTLNQALGK